MFLEKNQQVSVEDLIKGISIVSGNDACIVIAEGLNGMKKFRKKNEFESQGYWLNKLKF